MIAFCAVGWAVVQMGPAMPANAADSSPAGSRSTDTPINLNQDFVISALEIHSVEKDALAGSQDAALRLAAYNNFVTLQSDKGLYWLTIAAENGSVTGMYNTGLRLLQSRNANDHVRARYWLLKVRQLGTGETLQLTNELLQQLDRQPN